MTAIPAVLAAVAALQWFPAADWAERPDPSASPLARRGGTLRLNGGPPPKSVNAYVDGNSYTAMMFGLMYGTLLGTDSRTLDFEPALARRWAVSEDGREFRFLLDARARWSDGRPLTAEDVLWTFARVMDPASDTGSWKTMLGVFEPPTAPDARTVVFRKKGASPKDWRDLMHCGFFPILPKHHFANQSFNACDFVGAPVSGPYRLARLAEQVESVYLRVDGWWRENAPALRGVYNFDRLVLRHYADNENAFEALKKRMIDLYPVYSARIMNEGTRTDAFARNWILKRRVRNGEPVGFQGFAMNLRRAPFDDVRVRKALAHLLDRATMNRTMMNGEYFLLKSYFHDLYDARTPCENPDWAYDPETAARLLDEAGWRRGADGQRARNGRPFAFTFLARSAMEEKFLALYDHALRAQGIRMTIDRKDFASWMRDMDAYNFDMTWAAWGASVFRNPETMWCAAEGRRKGGNNITGFANAEVDRLIAEEKTMMSATARAAAYRRIDRILTKEVPYVLLWHTDEHRLIYWNKFGTPPGVLGRLGFEDGALAYWWYDADRVAELDAAVKGARCLPHVAERVEMK